MRATRSPRRCSPTASISSAGRSSIIGPRGIFSHGAEEPNALLSVDRGGGRVDPNNRASEHRGGRRAVGALAEPLAVARLRCRRGQRCAVAAARRRLLLQDLHVAAVLLGQALRAVDTRRGGSWPGAAARPIPTATSITHAHCDVLVVGAGPAGLAAALAASEGGKRVILADEQAEMGGALLHETTSSIDGKPAWDVARGGACRSGRARERHLLPRTTAFGYYNHNHIGLVQRLTDHLPQPHPDLPRERLWQVRAAEVVLATGAHERPLVFADNDRPGIMLAESLRAYVNRYGVAPGRRAVIATSGASAYTAAADLKTAGLEVSARRPAPGSPIARGGRGLARGRLRGPDRAHRSRIARAQARHRPDRRSRRRVGGDRQPAHARLRLRRPIRRLDAGGAPVLAVAREARASMRPSTPSCRGRPCRPSVRPAPPRAPTSSSACLEEGWAAGAAAAGLASVRAFTASASRTGFRPVRIMPGCERPAARPCLRRPAERRHRRGYRPCGARGLRGDRARQALHHHRHGHRPGQDLQHGRPGPGRRGAATSPCRRWARRRFGRPIRR